MFGIVLGDERSVARKLTNLLGDPVTRGQEFLQANAKNLHSVTDENVPVPDNYAQLLILETTGSMYVSPPPLFGSHPY